MNWNEEAEAIMRERFGGDSLIALATAADNIPWVRGVNATYQDGYFYIITYDRSQKMEQIRKNPQVAISGSAPSDPEKPPGGYFRGLVHLSRRGRKPGMVPERGKPGDCRQAVGGLFLLD